MLDLHVVFRRSHRATYSLILLVSFVTSPLHSSQFWENESKVVKHFEHEWIARYFESIDDDTEIGEVIDFLAAIRESWIVRGYECPSLLELAIRLREHLSINGIEFDEKEIPMLYEEIYKREQLITPTLFRQAPTNYSKPVVQLCKHKHKHKDKGDKKEFKMKSKGVFGFLKALAGGLMCLVPIPAVQLAGGALVADGIKDMIDDARETGDENELQQKMDELKRQEAQMLNPQQ
jgi:hypothetical protein